MNRYIIFILFLLEYNPTFSQVDYKTQIEPILYERSMPPSFNDVTPSKVELVKNWTNKGALEKPKIQIKIPLIAAIKVQDNTTRFSQSTLDTLALIGLEPMLNQYLGIGDFNNDGLDDVVMGIAGESTINTFCAMFSQQILDGETVFIEDPNYLMDIEGETSGSF